MMADPDEETPRIAPIKKRRLTLLVILGVGLATMAFHALVGLAILGTAIVMMILIGPKAARCGNCGAGLDRDTAKHWKTCGATFRFEIA